MRFMLVLALVMILAAPAIAQNLGNRAPDKPARTLAPPPPDPAMLRQGGETLADAVPVPIPSIDLEGTTAGYYDDYDEVCPYTFSSSPDVVYSILPETDLELDIDLCMSQYDTKVFVYDQNLNMIACNDDFYGGDPCGVYVSKIERMFVVADVQYFIVVDGYGGDWGDYLLDIVPYEPCVLDCPGGAEPEGEPPLAIDYLDVFNGGCNTDLDEPPFRPITAELFCGVSGFYNFEGSSYRDTDWFLVEIPAGGVLEITGDAELETYMFELGPQDCNEVAVVQNVIIGPCQEGTMTITGAPGDLVWFWVGPTTFEAPGGQVVFEYDYVLQTNLEPVATEDASWSSVKALFR